MINIDAQDAQDFLSGNGWLPEPGIRKFSSDHRQSRLLVQEALVLLILCILCIDVQSVEYQFSGTLHLLAIGKWIRGFTLE